jgi:hypothetical protein
MAFVFSQEGEFVCDLSEACRGVVKRFSTWGRITVKGGPTPCSEWRWGFLSSGAHRGDGHCSASCGLGSRTVSGCLFCRPVAEVGERHLPGVFKAIRKVSRKSVG